MEDIEHVEDDWEDGSEDTSEGTSEGTSEDTSEDTSSDEEADGNPPEEGGNASVEDMSADSFPASDPPSF